LIAPFILPRLESTVAKDHDILQQLRGSPSQTHLDALYVHLLSTCSHGKRKGRKRSGKLLGTVVLLSARPTPTLLATLLQLPVKEVAASLQSFVDARLLTSDDILDSVTDTTPLRACHNSLYEFLIDPQRCRVTEYLVLPANGHEALLDRCLSLLNEHLRQDICDIRSPGIANTDVLDLPARIARCVPEAMRYACMFWPVHLAASGYPSGPVSAALPHFCTEHLLNWLEVLSLLGELSSAEKYLPIVIAWCQVSILCAN
jgi:hypothetical protein